MEDGFQDIIESLSVLEKDATVPKNVRIKVKTAIDFLANSEKNISIRVDQSIEALGDICDDPHLQPYIKMQIWTLVSQLESK
jgi:uncharacterized protein (UPF0147 family)